MMVNYTEQGKITIKDEFQEIGWSVLDSSIVYKVKRIKYSIADGIISTGIWYANSERSEYKSTIYRNLNNNFIRI